MRPMAATDLATMTGAEMKILAKNNIPGFSTMKVDALRKALQTFMEKNPGKIVLPGASTSIAAPGPAPLASAASLPSPPGSATRARVPITAAAVAAANLKSRSTATSESSPLAPPDLTDCSVLECNDVHPTYAYSKCTLCALYFCEMHGAHTSHSCLGLKKGRVPARAGADWESNLVLSRQQEEASAKPKELDPESDHDQAVVAAPLPVPVTVAVTVPPPSESGPKLGEPILPSAIQVEAPTAAPRAPKRGDSKQGGPAAKSAKPASVTADVDTAGSLRQCHKGRSCCSTGQVTDSKVKPNNSGWHLIPAGEEVELDELERWFCKACRLAATEAANSGKRRRVKPPAK